MEPYIPMHEVGAVSLNIPMITKGALNEENIESTIMRNHKYNTVTENMPSENTSNCTAVRKGQKVSLNQLVGGIVTGFNVFMSWDVKRNLCDLDTSVFMLGKDGKVIGDDWFVFYGQPKSPDNAIEYMVNKNTVGDRICVAMNLSRVSQQVQRLRFVTTINEAIEHGLNFGDVKRLYLRGVDASTGKDMIFYELSDYYNNVVSMVVCELYRHNGGWKFSAVGNGVDKDLAGLCSTYGVTVV